MKTAGDKFLIRLAADLLDRYGDDLHDVAVVFNNKRPGIFLKKYMAELSGKPIWSPQLFTVQKFFESTSDLVPASPIRQCFTLLKEYNLMLTAENQPTVSPDVFYPIAEVITSDFSQIDYYLADPAKVFSMIGNIAQIQLEFPSLSAEELEFMKSFWASFSNERHLDVQKKFVGMWRRMPHLYNAFHARLRSQGLTTTARIFREMAESDELDHDLFSKFRHVVFAGFNALTRSEEKIFKRWQDAGGCSFYFDIDGHYFDDKTQEAGHFVRRNMNIVGLENALGEPLHRINDPQKEINVIQAVGYTAQAKLLCDILPHSDGVAPDSRAVILADEGLLLPVLQTITDDNLNITMGYPFEQSPVFGLCDLWARIQEELAGPEKDMVSYQNVLTCMFNPLLHFSQADRDRIQNEIFNSKKTQFHANELSPLSRNAGQLFSSFGKDPAKAVESLGNLLLFVLSELKDVRKLESLLIQECVKALNVLKDSFHEIGVDNPDVSLGTNFIIRTIRRALTGITVPFEGEPLSGIQVMGLLETRCLDFDEIIVLGMGEGVLPKTSQNPSFLPHNVRRAFGLPVAENQNAIFAYFFYRLLHFAKKVTLVYDGVTDENSTGEESRFIRQLRFETNCRFTEMVQQSQSMVTPSDKAIVIPKSAEVQELLSKYFKRNSDAKYDKKIAATHFTEYVSCSLRFFFRRVAGFTEVPDPPDKVGPNLVGSMLHLVMELFYRDAVGNEVTAEYITSRESRLAEYCQFALKETLNADAAANAEYDAIQQILLKVLEQYARSILRHDEKLVPFDLIEIENRDSYLPLIDLNVNGEVRQVRLQGIIDRVDRVAGKLRIVDYKTGRDKLKYRDFESLFSEEGKHQNKALLQTLFYTFVYEQARDTTGTEPHLYTVRDLSKGTLFTENKRGGLALVDENLEFFKTQFEARLREKLSEIFDPAVPFRQTTNIETCKYCPYKTICQR